MQQLTEVLMKNKKEMEQIEQFKREWGAGISHDLNTPLTYIKSYSTMMLSDQHNWSEEEKKKFLTEIAHKAHHPEELIKDLNLSFQMDCLRIPLSGQTSDIVEFVRRIVADVASDPRASKHALDFAALEDRIEAVFDQKLLRRSAIGSFLTGVCVLIILRKH